MTVADAKKIFGELMQKARTGRLTEHDKALLSRARQTIRMERRGRVNRPKQVPQPGKYRNYEAYMKAFACYKGWTLKQVHRYFKAGKAPKKSSRSNPKTQERQLIRMGRLVEIRYYRDHGQSRGFYKHHFKTRPTLYYDRSRNQILAG